MQNLQLITSGFNDGLIEYTMPGYALLGIISLPLILIGIMFSLIKRTVNAQAFLYWLIASLPVPFIIVLEIQRANTFYIPLIGLTAIGIIGLYDQIKNHKIKYLFLGTILISFISYSLLFTIDYFNNYSGLIRGDFYPGLGIALAQAKTLAGKKEKIYVSNQITLNYVETRFYLKVDPVYFRKNSNYKITSGGITGTHFQNYYFDPARLDLQKGESYIYVLTPGENINCGRQDNVFVNDLWIIGRCLNS
jgi:hypothetical protein